MILNFLTGTAKTANSFVLLKRFLDGILLPHFMILLTTGILLQACNAQVDRRQIVGGGCDGCEKMFIGMPKYIQHESMSVGWLEASQKLIVTGKVLQLDGRTPAPGVLVYYWHTDESGLYTYNENTPEEVRDHGALRGWVKSDNNGNYTIKTSRPAAYPGEQIPQHIHLSIKEPEIDDEYYADLYFDDDPLYLNYIKKYGKFDRAGTEILRVVIDDEVQIAEHNIVLGLNIPNYPLKQTSLIESGLNIGEDQPSFLPFHAFGPDKGTRACPVCKYGRYHGIIYFVGNEPDWYDIRLWLKYLDEESVKREKYLKAYFVYGNSHDYDKNTRYKLLEDLGEALDLKKIALTFVPSFMDAESEIGMNNINSNLDNTFIIFRHRTIVEKFINLKPNSSNFNIITEALDNTRSAFFDLPEPSH